MADDDGKPTDSTDPRFRQPAQVKPVAPAPRVNPPNINSPKESAGGNAPPGFGDFLEWMRVQMGGTATSTEKQRTLIPKEQKKFQRRDAEAKADKAGPSIERLETPANLPTVVPIERSSEHGATERDLPRPFPDEARTTSRSLPPSDATDPSGSRMRRGQQAAVKRNPWVGLLIQVVVLGLLAGSFFLGRVSVRRTAAVANAAPAAPEVVDHEGKATTKLLSDANAALIDQAMAAEQASEFKKASDLLQKVKASGEHVHGLVFQIAQLAVFNSEYNRAVPLLNDALSEGEELASVYNLRATLSARASLFRNNSANDYETATRIDPFDARNFFYWGASLRRAGKFQLALEKLHQALDRLREPTAEGLYRLAIRLTQIELGQESEFTEELNKQIALPYPSIDWLFTAAALKARDGKSADAAALLTRAEQCGDPDGFALRLRDYYFYQYQFVKELKPFFDRLKPAAPGSVPTPPPPTPAGSPSADASPPAVGLDVPTLPPPATPGATVAH